MNKYVSLHNYTCYSIMRSISKPEDLLEAANKINAQAVAITDYCSLAGIWEAINHKLAKKIKIIVGCELNFVLDRSVVFDYLNNVEKQKPIINKKKIVLIAKNQTGYHNLLMLNYEAEKCKLEKLSKIDKVSLIDFSLLNKYKDGLICLTGGSCGVVNKNLTDGAFEYAKKEAVILQNIFKDDFYFELQPNYLIFDGAEQFAVNRGLLKLSKELNIKCIAASNSYYTEKSQIKYLDFLLAIKNKRSYRDNSRPKIKRDEFYLHSEEDIVSFFERNYGKEFGEMLCTNTLEIANKCERPEWVKPQVVTKENALLPEFPVINQPDYSEFVVWLNNNKLENLKTDHAYMRFLCEKELKKFENLDNYDVYYDRYVEEREVFESMDFCSYMLITSDFLNWGRNNGVRIGPGRGSVGGSLVGKLLNIHQIDPIKYGLIFPRFLNVEKKEFPDVDNDLDSVGRESVIEYVKNKYGKDHVACVSNFITFTPKNALTDVITCLEIGGSRSDAFKIAKNLTETISNDDKNLKQALDSSPLLKEFTEKYDEIKDFTDKYIGLPRSYATHAAGIIVSKYPLAGLVPVRIDDFNNVCLEYEKVKAEQNGLIKIDFLGLENLSIIEETNKIIASLNLPLPKDPPDFEEYDPKIYDLISSGNTFGVFQLGESGGTIDLCKKIKPKNLEDLAVINALTRPGVTPDVKKSYIERRFGREEVEIPHKNFIEAVKSTMGLPIFEECFLFLAHYFCGWNLSKCDNMRKISKLKSKGKQILEQLKDSFIKDGSKHSDVSEEFVTSIWEEWVVPLSGYAFNKSHAVLYSIISHHTAYLKTHYFAPYMTAKLISDTKSNSPKAKDKILKNKHELRKNNIVIKPPNVNTSDSFYKLKSLNEIVTGFSALHGVKPVAAEDIVSKRPFVDFDDFLKRIDASKVRAPVVEALAASGALDDFGLSRKFMFLYGGDIRKKIKAVEKNKNKNKKFQYKYINEEWSKGELRALEYHYLGEALSGDKRDSFPTLFRNIKAFSINKILYYLEEKESVICELEIKDLFTFKVKNKDSKIYNQEICRMIGEDQYNDQIAIVCFPDQLEELKNKYELINNGKLEKGFGGCFSCTVSKFQGETSLILSSIYDLVNPVGLPADIKDKRKAETLTEVDLKQKDNDDVIDDLLLILE